MLAIRWKRALFALCCGIVFIHIASEGAFAEKTISRRVIEEPPITKGCLAPLALNTQRSWNPQESWAWEKRLCLGKTADLNEWRGGKPGACEDLARGSSPSDLTLSDDFLETILFEEPFREIANRRGIHIRCARFAGRLDFSGRHFSNDIKLTKVTVAHGIDARSFSLDGDLIVRGAFDENKVDLRDTNISGRLQCEPLYGWIENIRQKHLKKSTYDVTGNTSQSRDTVDETDADEVVIPEVKTSQRRDSAEVIEDSEADEQTTHEKPEHDPKRWHFRSLRKVASYLFNAVFGGGPILLAFITVAPSLNLCKILDGKYPKLSFLRYTRFMTGGRIRILVASLIISIVIQLFYDFAVPGF